VRSWRRGAGPQCSIGKQCGLRIRCKRGPLSQHRVNFLVGTFASRQGENPFAAAPPRTTADRTGPARGGLAQPLAAPASAGCSTSSPSIVIWISSLTTILPSRIALKLSPKSFLLIFVVAP